MRLLTLCLFALMAPVMVSAEPAVKIINFTADWCPNCQILNPEMRAAVSEFQPGEIEIINLDMTHAGRGSSEYQRNAVYADAIRLADSHMAAYLWDWYGGVTGLATIISADNGEPISCINRLLDARAIEGRLQEAIIISKRRTPGIRMPEGPECPPPMR